MDDFKAEHDAIEGLVRDLTRVRSSLLQSLNGEGIRLRETFLPHLDAFQTARINFAFTALPDSPAAYPLVDEKEIAPFVTDLQSTIVALEEAFQGFSEPDGMSVSDYLGDFCKRLGALVWAQDEGAQVVVKTKPYVAPQPNQGSDVPHVNGTPRLHY